MRRHYNSHIISTATPTPNSNSTSNSSYSLSNNTNNSKNNDHPIINRSLLFSHPPSTTNRKRSRSKSKAIATKVLNSIIFIVVSFSSILFVKYYYYDYYHHDDQSNNNTTLVVAPHHVRTKSNVLQSNIPTESTQLNETFHEQQQLDDFSSKKIEIITNTTRKIKDKTEIIIRGKQQKHQHNTISYNNSGSYNNNIPPLHYPIDYEKFTIRINTWKRTEQLKASIEHFSTCTAVCQLQIIWCIDQGEPPTWLLSMENETNNSAYNNNTNICSSSTKPSIIIERHVNNSLNERFLMLQPVYTAGVLSIDDDVIRPCFAIHAAFVKWTYNPDRQIGFDARSHDITLIQHPTSNNTNNKEVQEEQWGYSYLSTTEKNNKYSITLTRFSFIHQYYLQSYWTTMPAIIREYTKDNKNCEDIAMSLYISSLTNNTVPLLVDYWIIKSQIQLYVPNKISGGSNHKAIRNDCFNMFSTILQLKTNTNKLQLTPLRHTNDKYHGFYEYGILATDWNKRNVQLQIEQSSSNSSSSSVQQFQQTILQTINHWKHKGSHTLFYHLQQMRKNAAQPLYDKGMLDKKLKSKTKKT